MILPTYYILKLNMYYNYDITHILNIYKLILSDIITIIYSGIANKLLLYVVIITISIGIFRNNKQLLNRIYKLENTLQEKEKIEINFEKKIQQNKNKIELISNKNTDLEKHLIHNEKIIFNKIEKIANYFLILEKQINENKKELNNILNKIVDKKIIFDKIEIIKKQIIENKENIDLIIEA